MQWIFLFLLGTVSCHNMVSEDIEYVENKLSEIPGFENLNQSAIPSVEELQNAIKQKCEDNGGPNAFEKLGTAKDDLQKCIESNFNLTQIQEELKEARKTGSMDEVFAKHCLKVPIVQECIRKAASIVEPCLQEEEKSNLGLLLNITESLANFVCDKDGDRIAMFVADGGFECLQNKKDDLEQCVNKTLGHHIPQNLSVNHLPVFVIDKETCKDYTNLQNCVTDTLEKCKDDTPANIVDALFKYIRRTTPCKNHPTSDGVSHERFLRSATNEQGLNDLFSQVKLNYEPHCLKNGGQIAADNFRETLDQVKNCSNLVQFNFTEKVKEVKGIPFDYLCKNFRLGIRGCLNTLSERITACSSPEEVYVPKFGIDLYDSLFNFYCKDNARALKKFLGERDACMNKIHNSTRFCLNKTKYIEVHAKDNVVTKSELCGDLKTLRNCFLDVAAQQCYSNANTNEFVVGLSDALYAPCSTCRLFVPNMLLFILLLINVHS